MIKDIELDKELKIAGEKYLEFMYAEFNRTELGIDTICSTKPIVAISFTQFDDSQYKRLYDIQRSYDFKNRLSIFTFENGYLEMTVKTFRDYKDMATVFSLDFDSITYYKEEVPAPYDLDYLSMLTDEYEKNNREINEYLKNEVKKIEECEQSSVKIVFY
ncbi:hypothetical protein P7D73_21970 [Enterococcus raffinosus]|uniref:hypothetical protein n=1 Tax=Enterococcus raffinosus TaxID=71452 RepID=UPI0028919F37|nr:hypothetical protein [Enterococcus raffinosus]MDT2525099.1 hypothetical protein [Enterococcus raffinosus]MDT2593212.1 hypothetical protein [Enterococcus raffinosus]